MTVATLATMLANAEAEEAPDPTSAAKALHRAGLLLAGEGRNLQRREWVPSEGGQRRGYVIAGSILD